MHSANLVFAAAALAGLASAVPHARNHYYLHGRPIALGETVTGRSIYDGKCGPGDTCGPGYCCSQWGYCGTTQDYCGAGCQPQYGTCGAGNGTAPSSSDTPTAPAPAPSLDNLPSNPSGNTIDPRCWTFTLEDHKNLKKAIKLIEEDELVE